MSEPAPPPITFLGPTARPVRRGGRPQGSKNKPKVSTPVDTVVRDGDIETRSGPPPAPAKSREEILAEYSSVRRVAPPPNDHAVAVEAVMTPAPRPTIVPGSVDEINPNGDLARPQRYETTEAHPRRSLDVVPNDDYIVISLPGGGTAKVRRQDVMVDPAHEAPEGSSTNFRCMVYNTMIPTGHPDWYTDPDERKWGQIVCPLCQSACVIQLRDERGVWIAPPILAPSLTTG